MWNQNGEQRDCRCWMCGHELQLEIIVTWSSVLISLRVVHHGHGFVQKGGMKGITVYESSKLKSERGGRIKREKEGDDKLQELKSYKHKSEGKISGLLCCQDFKEFFSLPFNWSIDVCLEKSWEAKGDHTHYLKVDDVFQTLMTSETPECSGALCPFSPGWHGCLLITVRRFGGLKDTGVAGWGLNQRIPGMIPR